MNRESFAKKIPNYDRTVAEDVKSKRGDGMKNLYFSNTRTAND